MDKYVNIRDHLFKLSILSRLKDGRYVMSFWVNYGTADQDLLTITVDKLIKVPNDDKEVYRVDSKQVLGVKKVLSG